MIFRRLTLALAAAACLAVGAGMAVVSLGYAIFAALQVLIGPAWAAACVALVAVLIAAIAGLVLARAARAGHHHRRRDGRGGAPTNLADTVGDLVRDRPVAAAAVAAAVGWVLTRNPGLAGALGALISRSGRRRD